MGTSLLRSENVWSLQVAKWYWRVRTTFLTWVKRTGYSKEALRMKSSAFLVRRQTQASLCACTWNLRIKALCESRWRRILCKKLSDPKMGSLSRRWTAQNFRPGMGAFWHPVKQWAFRWGLSHMPSSVLAQSLVRIFAFPSMPRRPRRHWEHWWRNSHLSWKWPVTADMIERLHCSIEPCLTDQSICKLLRPSSWQTANCNHASRRCVSTVRGCKNFAVGRQEANPRKEPPQWTSNPEHRILIRINILVWKNIDFDLTKNIENINIFDIDFFWPKILIQILI